MFKQLFTIGFFKGYLRKAFAKDNHFCNFLQFFADFLNFSQAWTRKWSQTKAITTTTATTTTPVREAGFIAAPPQPPLSPASRPRGSAPARRPSDEGEG